jgi:D-alanine-D-alanine ligase
MTTRVALIFGGRSPEHDVSILSARSVAAVAPRLDIIPICMGRDGIFIEPHRSRSVLEGRADADSGDPAFSFETWWRGGNADVAFPLIHGVGGEDGVLQGYLESIGAPYTGSGVAASAVSMDKAHMKHAFAAARLPVVETVPVTESEWQHERERVIRSVANTLRLPYFVKPANSGSSIGVTKVKSDRDFAAAVETAFRFDDKVLVERGLDAREIEVSILGNDRPEASVPGEIVPAREFYDYEDKYADGQAELIIPAKLPNDKTATVRKLGIAAFQAVGAAGYARVDCFLERGTNRLFVNEINTIPGFTAISMYPKLWEATEVKYSRLIERLIELALERHAARGRRHDQGIEWLRGARKIT